MSDPSWTTIAVDAPVKCPHCHRTLGEVGPALEVWIRIHPHGPGAKPTRPAGFSHRCQRCNTQLDLCLLPRVVAVA